MLDRAEAGNEIKFVFGEREPLRFLDRNEDPPEARRACRGRAPLGKCPLRREQRRRPRRATTFPVRNRRPEAACPARAEKTRQSTQMMGDLGWPVAGAVVNAIIVVADLRII